MAQRVLDSLVSPLTLPNARWPSAPASGSHSADRAETRADRLLADADAAMYRAKREGKGCYRVFETAMHTASVERMTLEQELRVRSGMTPSRCTSSPSSTRHRSARSRSKPSPDGSTRRGFVPPDKFIPLAEESGLILDLGWTVLLEACLQARRWNEWFPDATYRSRSTPPACSWRTGGSPTRWPTRRPGRSCPRPPSLEVTESVLASESGRVIDTLDDLRRTGVRVAIDDFGTGYSSFAALADLPIDILKIDKRFIDNLLKDDQGRGFVNAIMQLARTLHLETTAEGVESPAAVRRPRRARLHQHPGVPVLPSSGAGSDPGLPVGPGRGCRPPIAAGADLPERPAPAGRRAPGVGRRCFHRSALEAVPTLEDAVSALVAVRHDHGPTRTTPVRWPRPEEIAQRGCGDVAVAGPGAAMRPARAEP